MKNQFYFLTILENKISKDFSRPIRLQFLTILFLLSLLIVLPQIDIKVYPQSTIVSKSIVFLYSCFAICCLVFLRIFSLKKLKIVVSKIDIGIFSLITYIITNRYLIQYDYSFSLRFIELFGLLILYVVLGTFNNKETILILLAIVLSGILQAIYASLQMLDVLPSNHSVFKTTGSFFNPGPYAGFLTPIFLISLSFYIYRNKIVYFFKLKNKQKKSFLVDKISKQILNYLPLVGTITIALAILTTGSRASWLSILMGSFLLLELKYKICRTHFKKLSNYKITTVVVIFIILIISGTFAIYNVKKESSDGRLFIWKTAVEIIKDNPIFGVGFDRFKTYYMNYQANYFSENGETKETLVADNSNYAFNEFLQFIVENGCIGFISLSILCFFILKIKTKEEDWFLGMILKISLLSIAIFACFSYSMQILPIKIVLFSCLALFANLDVKMRMIELSSTTSSMVGVVSLLVISVGLYFGYSYTKELSKNYIIWKKGFKYYQYDNYEKAIDYYEKAYPFFRKNGEFLMNYGKALSISKKDKKAIAILTEAKLYLNNTIIETALGDAYKGDKQYANAELAYTKAYDMIPVRFYPLYLLGKLYDESGQKKKAIEIANKVLKKEVKIPSTAIREIKLEMKKIIN